MGSTSKGSKATGSKPMGSTSKGSKVTGSKATGSKPTGSKPAGAPRRPAGDLRIRVALVASGLAAATSLVYTAPGTPWARADVLTTRVETSVTPGSQPEPVIVMGHNSASNFGKIIRTPGGTVLIDATPATAGINTVAVTVLDGKDVPAKVEKWSATAELPGSGLPKVTVPLASFGAGVAAADAKLAFPGDWTLTVTVQVAGAGSTTVTQIVPIAEHS
jgi:hypothetical protein